MSRRFDGTDDQVQWSIGGCNLTGAFTFACVAKFDTGVAWQGMLGNETAATGSEMAIGRHGGTGNLAVFAGGGVNTQNAVAVSSSDGWCLYAVTKAAGTVLPRMHKHPIGGAATRANAGGNVADGATQAGGKIVFGQIDGSDPFDGWLAVAAEFATALSDANVTSLATTLTRANWLSKGAVGLWDELDAFATDHTGGGASRTSLVGTTDDADDPTGWASWAPAVDPTDDVYVRVADDWLATDRVSRVGGEWV